MQFFILLLYYLTVFSEFLAQKVWFFSYLDELLPIFLIFVILLFEKKIWLDKQYSQMLLYFIGFCIYTLIPTLIFRIQTDSLIYLKDIWAFTKFFSVSLLLIQLFKKKHIEKYINQLAIHSKFWLITIFCFGLLSQIFDLGMVLQYTRFGIKSYQFIFSHPTILVFSIITLYLILFVSGTKNKNIYTLITIFTLLLTGRSKAVIFVIILLFSLFSDRVSLKRIKVSRFISIGFLSLFLLLINLPKIKIYIAASTYSARPLLYLKVPQIIFDTNGLGYGLGTYATHISGEYYSSLYYKYNLQYIIGLTPDNYSYIGDTFWPSIIGQFGVIGTLVFIILCVKIFSYFFKTSQKIINKRGVILIISYIMIGSFVESIFINTAGAFFPVLLAFIAHNRSNDDKSIINR